MQKKHLVVWPANSRLSIACGLNAEKSLVTGVAMKVTCNNCKRTGVYEQHRTPVPMKFT